MSNLSVFLNLTLDGVMQAPGRPDEDTRGGFTHGGWAAPYGNDPVIGRFVGENMGQTGSLLFGRRTYEDFYSVWPNRTDNPFTAVLNNSQKYVASRTLKEPLAWMNSTLLNGDVVQAVAALKDKPGKDLLVLGSGNLLQTLIRHNLIDSYILLIHPLVLGSGTRLFAEGLPAFNLKLVASQPTTTGVIIATYAPA